MFSLIVTLALLVYTLIIKTEDLTFPRDRAVLKYYFRISESFIEKGAH